MNMNEKQTILIVDDSKFNRDILKEILGETYHYLEAENGNQAIQLVGDNLGIDLILLDIHMRTYPAYPDSNRIDAEKTDKNIGYLSFDRGRHCFDHNGIFSS